MRSPGPTHLVVLVSGSEQLARDEKEALAAYLGAELNLTLSSEKTHVTALTEGFEFLGHRIRLRWDDRWGYWPRVEIPKEKARDLCYRIKQLTNRGHTRRSFLPRLGQFLSALLLRQGCVYTRGPLRVGPSAALAAEKIPQDTSARDSSWRVRHCGW